MSNVIDADAAKLAGLQIDLLQKLRSGQFTIGQLQWFLGLSKTQRDMLCCAKFDLPIPNFSTCGIIPIGTHSRVGELITAIEDSGSSVSFWARNIMHQPTFTIAKKNGRISLVKVPIGELGFSNGATLEEIFKRAKELGLHLCPAEVGPQLRRAYNKSIGGLLLIIAMNPIVDSHNHPRLFYIVYSGNVSQLNAFWIHPSHVWSSDDVFVFASS